MANGESLNRLVADCIISPTLSKTLLDKTKRIATLSEGEFTVEEKQILAGIEAQDIEDFFRQALEGLGSVVGENNKKGIERES